MEVNMEVDLIEILFEPLNISKYLRDAYIYIYIFIYTLFTNESLSPAR